MKEMLKRNIYALSLILLVYPGQVFSLNTKIINPNFLTAPRPGLMPESIMDLTGIKWEFAVGDDGQHLPGIMRKSLFPHQIQFGLAPEADDSGLNYETMRNPESSRDILWYRQEILLPEDWKGALLTFEGIDYESEIYINGHYAFSHQGAYAPFEADITAFLAQGSKVDGGTKHVITIRAEDDRTRRDRAVGKQERRRDEGVIFYGNSSGAWKGAYLRKINPQHYIADFKVRTNSQGLFSYSVDIQGASKGPFTTEIEVMDRQSKAIKKHRSLDFSGNSKIVSEFFLPNPKLWTPDGPHLYDIKIKLLHQGVVVETLRSYTGFSDFTQQNGHFLLNQKPFYLRGVLNQMVYPRSLYTPGAGDNARDIWLTRRHGFNFQRIHQTTPRWRDIYEMENGVLVKDAKTKKFKRQGLAWALEMPSARDLRSPQALAQFLKEWKEIIQAYGHGHPGLLYYVAGNEDWGMLEDPDHWASATDAEREAFQISLVTTTLEAAPPGALVSPGDGWRQITGMKNGKPLPGINPSQLILSSHDYRGTRNELAAHYQHLPVNPPAGTPLPVSGKELLLNGFDFPGSAVAPMLGEFGGKSYAPPGIGNVFGYGHVYRNINDWTRDTLEQLKAMGQIKIFRGGYVYTQVRDAGFKPHRPLPADKPAGELNGFLGADGFPKSNPALWMEINLNNQKTHDTNQKTYELLEGPITSP